MLQGLSCNESLAILLTLCISFLRCVCTRCVRIGVSLDAMAAERNDGVYQKTFLISGLTFYVSNARQHFLAYSSLATPWPVLCMLPNVSVPGSKNGFLAPPRDPKLTRSRSRSVPSSHVLNVIYLRKEQDLGSRASF